MSTNLPGVEYVGFWRRVWATIIDSILLMAVLFPPLISIYGWEYFDSTALIVGPADFFISWVLPAVVWVLLWRKYQATPGKLAISARIVDARTGRPATTAQYVARYLGYYVSLVFLGLGYIWVAFDDRRQGWHDKIAGTIVIRKFCDAAADKLQRNDA